MPRKSNVSMMSTEDGTPVQSGMSVEDLNLPKTMVNRLAKGVLPANTNLQLVTQSAISKSATVFVNYLTSHASDIASRQNKKTIQPRDVFEALKELEFEAFIPRVEGELQRYNTIQCDKRNSYRRRLKEEKLAAEAQPTDAAAAPSTAGAETGGAPGANGHARGDDDDSAPASKKMRRDIEDSGMDMEDVDEGEDEGEEEQDEEDEDEEGEDEEEEEEEDDEEADDAAAAAQLREDPLEPREDGDGNESQGSESEGTDY
ncbi:histone-fold-containing protein [Saccharata proteae CBS 121410]|uniref:DNA polymerase epsilon subunit D n=1 Tax=Saccharata proteae CBS 121410 TaxID=1314787 RepID=A0A6A5YCF1_9PEZI|nr:histone-fold-containing protein [Saccharata proteae CBS 121410]